MLLCYLRYFTHSLHLRGDPQTLLPFAQSLSFSPSFIANFYCPVVGEPNNLSSLLLKKKASKQTHHSLQIKKGF